MIGRPEGEGGREGGREGRERGREGGKEGGRGEQLMYIYTMYILYIHACNCMLIMLPVLLWPAYSVSEARHVFVVPLPFPPSAAPGGYQLE